MRKIGLTGGIATGKSTAVAVLRQEGAPVVDADMLAHEVLAPGGPGVPAVREAFGPSVFDADGRLDRHALAGIVFSDKKALKTLNGIVHPWVRRKMEDEIEAIEQSGALAVVLDIPLLLESKLTDRVDEVWVVYAPRALQVARLCERNGFSVAEAERRIAAQMPIEEKRGYADVLIDNTGPVSALQETVRRLWRKTLEDCRR